MQVPNCPERTKTVWTGYSLASLTAGFVVTDQDLGNSGSCVERFDIMAMMACQGETSYNLTFYLHFYASSGMSIKRSNT